nr:hypothetical protein [Clostridia bacterium]
TRAAAPYRTGKYAYTGSKDGKTVNAFYLYDENETAPDSYAIPFEGTAVSVTDLRSGAVLEFTQAGGTVNVTLPEALRGRDGDIADCFRIVRK